MPTSLLLSGAAETGGPKYYGSAGNVATLKNVGAWSLALWIRPDSLASTNVGNPVVLFARRGGSNEISLDLWDASGAPKLQLTAYHYEAGNPASADAGLQSPPIALTYGQWIHVVFVFNEGGNKSIKTYINGLLNTTSSASSLADPRTSDADRTLKLGLGTVHGSSLGGAIRLDDVGLYPSALPLADVTSLFEGALPGSVGSPVIAWSCDGTLDAAANLGDAGLPDAVLSTVSGAGTATYKAASFYQPPVLVSECKIQASRQMLGLVFRKADDSGFAKVLRRPDQSDLTNVVTVRVNGGAPVALDTPLWRSRTADGNAEPWLYYDLEALNLTGSEAVTVSTTRNWVLTDSGEVERLTDRAAPFADARGMLPAVPAAPRTMGVGFNFTEIQPAGFQVFANNARLSHWGNSNTPHAGPDPSAGAGTVRKIVALPDYTFLSSDYSDRYFTRPHETLNVEPSTNARNLLAGVRRWSPTGTWKYAYRAAGGPASVVVNNSYGGGSSLASHTLSDPAVRPDGLSVRTLGYATHATTPNDCSPFVELETTGGNTEHYFVDEDGYTLDDVIANPHLLHPKFVANAAGAATVRFMQPMLAGGNNSIHDLSYWMAESETVDHGYVPGFPVRTVASIEPYDPALVKDSYPIQDAKWGYVVAKVTTDAAHGFVTGDEVLVANSVSSPGAGYSYPTTQDTGDNGLATEDPICRFNSVCNVVVLSATEFLFFRRTFNGGVDPVPNDVYGTLVGAHSGADVDNLTARKQVRVCLSPEAMGDVCRQLGGARPWLTVPFTFMHMHTTAKDAQVATLYQRLIKYLPAGVAAIFEGSNEPWNYSDPYKSAAVLIANTFAQLPGTAPTITVTQSGGAIDGVTIATPGSGLLHDVFCTVAGSGGGSGAEIWLRVQGGQATEAAITRAGSGYSGTLTATCHKSPWTVKDQNDQSSLYRCVCLWSDKLRTLLRAAAVAEGRPASEVKVVIGTFVGGFGNADVADFYRAPWREQCDAKAIAPYYSTYHWTDAGDKAQALALTLGQKFDLLEMSCRFREADLMAAARAPRDAAGLDYELWGYECGPVELQLSPFEAGSPGSFDARQAFMADCTALLRSPRMRHLYQYMLWDAQQGGCSLYADFSFSPRPQMFQTSNAITAIWNYDHTASQGERPGIGDGSDGLNDNRAAPNVEGTSVSTLLYAWREWMGDAPAPVVARRKGGPASFMRARYFRQLRDRRRALAAAERREG